MSVRYWPLSLVAVCLAGPAWAGDHRADFEAGVVYNPDEKSSGGYVAAVVAVSGKGPISPQVSKDAAGPRRHAPTDLEKHPWAVVFSHSFNWDHKTYADTFGIRYTQVIRGTYRKTPPLDATASWHPHPWGFALLEASTGFYNSPTGKHAIYSVSGGLEAYIGESRRWGLRAQVGYAWLDHDDVEDHVRVVGGVVFRIPMGH